MHATLHAPLQATLHALTQATTKIASDVVPAAAAQVAGTTGTNDIRVSPPGLFSDLSGIGFVAFVENSIDNKRRNRKRRPLNRGRYRRTSERIDAGADV
ncbi:hypothetical protein B2J88_38355 [Rhodococcus sp. SRB_17]|nr:hypothetical protein [Rhodococcus sp. SRB_17]